MRQVLKMGKFLNEVFIIVGCLNPEYVLGLRNESRKANKI